MVARRLVSVSILAIALIVSFIPVAFGQTSEGPQPPKAAPAPSPAMSRKSEAAPVAPQVVTIVHRLNALKMFRLLLRAEDQVEAIANLDNAFNFTEDVHTNVIAGLALEDGETIAAWLPGAEVELGVPDFPVASFPTPPAVVSPMAARSPASPFPPARPEPSFYETPDLTVIGSDGKPLTAKYVGLDGVTGLSILRLSKKNLKDIVATDQDIDIGQSVKLFGPEPVRARPIVRGSLFVRIGTTKATIRSVLREPAGGVAEFKVLGPELSDSSIGSVVVSDSGETVGIVNAINRSEANILPVALIRRAATRVLERRASVPKPWLGVNGEPVAKLAVQELQNHGWQFDRASNLFARHEGILLTSVVPGGPASQASLRAGDVILKVNNETIEDGAEFSSMLEKAGPSNSVQFTVARPDGSWVESLDVKLSGLFDANWVFKLKDPTFKLGGFSLIDQGIETIALKPSGGPKQVTPRGLLVVYVQPGSAASSAGLQAGDIIQSINGKPARLLKRVQLGPSQPPVSSYEVLRKKEKLVLTIPNPGKKK